MTDAAQPNTVTAAILVIGDEILSGRTKDKNIGYIAEYLTNIGVDTKEVRVVPDIEEWFEAYYTIQFANYPVDAHHLSAGGVAVACARK